ncbi:MAG TPA: hypothetical protein P5186_05655 [Candidatus Paceibacterota bacterium]|nr:hypothetical protein [Candidatus Paceibacterota bacterium]HSA02131.1 hypothetical protein [Candidatus Paceibacterota bacterium]
MLSYLRNNLVQIMGCLALLAPTGIRSAELTPRLVGMHAVSSGNWQPVAVAASGSQAYETASDYNPNTETWENSLLVLDITNPSNPTRLGSLKARWIGDLAVRGDFALACASSDGLLVIDVSNPAAPRRVRSIPVGQATAVFLSGNYAYVADAMSGLVVVDISNPASPEVVGSFPIDFGAWSVLAAGSVAYVGGGNFQPLQLLDVSDPTTPHLLGTFESMARGILKDNRVYMFGGTRGMEILDVSNPASPRRLGGYQPNGLSWGIGVSGNHALLGIAGQGVAVIEIEPPPPPPPALTMVLAGEGLMIFWPVSDPGYGLEASDSLAPASSWQSEPAAPQVVGDQNVVTIEIGAGPRFFRLKKP